jgi:hypothetical protein
MEEHAIVKKMGVTALVGISDLGIHKARKYFKGILQDKLEMKKDIS